MTLRETFDKAWDEVTTRANCVVQEKEELFALAALMQAHGVRSYLELGASEGVSLYVLGCCLPEFSVVKTVDWGEAHSVAHLKRNVAELVASGYTAEAHLSSTQTFGTTYLYDAVLIDAGHTYEEAKADWERFKDNGKMVIFHDIRHPGVSELWYELRPKYRSLEIHSLNNTVPGGIRMGFGVIWPKKEMK